MTLSPFSLSHNWKLNWKRAPIRGSPKSLGESTKEYAAVNAVASVGVIGGVQLSRCFHLDKKRKKKMVHEGKLVRHEIQKGKQIIPIYTIGRTGADMISLADYEEGYWISYNVPEVLKRLLFFRLYGKFPKAKILPAPSPFLGTIKFKRNLFYVYVVRGDIQDLLMYLKWKSFAERMLIVTESLNHLQPLNIYAEDIKARVTTDDDLKDEFRDLFYLWNKNGWVKENQLAEQQV